MVMYDPYTNRFYGDGDSSMSPRLGDQPKWISVEERLPEKRFAVLIYCPYCKCTFTAYWDGENWAYFGGAKIEYVPFSVTHWMPLPAPPKEVE